MKKGLKGALVALGVLLPAAVLVVGGIWYAQQDDFFRDAEIIAGGEQDSAAQELSAQLGVELNPALEQHAYLLENRNRLAIHSGAIALLRVEEEGYNGDGYLVLLPEDVGTTGADDPIDVYTGMLEGDDFTATMVLIDSGRREYDGIQARGMEVILQMRARSEKFERTRRGMRAEITTNGFWSELEGDAFFCLHSTSGGCWAVKPANRSVYSNNLYLDRFPAAFRWSDGHAPIDLIQLCGRMNFAVQGDLKGWHIPFSFILGRLMIFSSDYETWWIEARIPTDTP